MFENGQIFHAPFVDALHDVVVVWPGSCNNVAPRHIMARFQGQN